MATSKSTVLGGDGGRPVAGRVVGIDPGLIVTGYAVVEPGVVMTAAHCVE